MHKRTREEDNAALATKKVAKHTGGLKKPYYRGDRAKLVQDFFFLGPTVFLSKDLVCEVIAFLDSNSDPLRLLEELFGTENEPCMAPPSWMLWKQVPFHNHVEFRKFSTYEVLDSEGQSHWFHYQWIQRKPFNKHADSDMAKMACLQVVCEDRCDDKDGWIFQEIPKFQLSGKGLLQLKKEIYVTTWNLWHAHAAKLEFIDLNMNTKLQHLLNGDELVEFRDSNKLKQFVDQELLN